MLCFFFLTLDTIYEKYKKLSTKLINLSFFNKKISKNSSHYLFW